MISDVDRTIENLFKKEFGSTLPFDLSFAIPDSNFVPASSSKSTLNCYLHSIVEDRDVRSLEPVLTRLTDGRVKKKRPPIIVKLSYVITAWSPAQEAPGVDPALDEHKLLSDVLLNLLKYPLVPNPLLIGTLAGIKIPLITTIIMPENVKNNGDFWKSIGGHLRASLDFCVKLPMDFEPGVTGPMVTTRIMGATEKAGFSKKDVSIQIGGKVIDNSSTPKLIPGAWVMVVETGKIVAANKDGFYTFKNIPAGIFTLKARAVGYSEGERFIKIPEPTGDYNITLSSV